MSGFHVEVVTIDKVSPHPNADKLEICTVRGFPVVAQIGAYRVGDTAVYVPVESVVPVDTDSFAFLATGKRDRERIKAKRLRGVYSQGLLVPCLDPSWEVGKDVAQEYGVTKWDPPIDSAITKGLDERDPGLLPVYTSIEALRRHPTVLQPGEQVLCTEKIHGANGRWMHDGERLWVGSHRRIKARSDTNLWWRGAAVADLENKLASRPHVVFYGEVYGQVQDLRYGAGRDEVRVAMFDAFDRTQGRYVDCAVFDALVKELGLPTVPTLYEGPWGDLESMLEMAEGKTVAGDGNHVREGYVVRPTVERFDPSIGRVILKAVGQGYYLRKSS